MLFAQQFNQQQGFGGGPGGAGGPPPGPPPEFWILFVIAMVVILAISLTIQIFFLLTLSRCLREVHPDNRKMEPAHVWFMLIPCFNLVWIFFIVTRIPDSVRDEFTERRLRGDGDFGRTIGMTYAVMVLLANIPYIGALFGIVALVCFIMFWIKIAGFSRTLREDREYSHDSESDDRARRRDDESDDRPGRRRDDEDGG